MIFGYARVSTTKVTQLLDRQIEALNKFAYTENFKFDEIVEDRASGKDFNRPNYSKLKSKLRKGDILIVKELDRFGRNAVEIQKELAELKQLGVKVIILDMPYLNDFHNAQNNDTMHQMIQDLMLTIYSYIAQIEREKIARRVKEGMAVAKKKGKPIGRKKLRKEDLPKGFKKYYNRLKRGELTAIECAKILGIGRSTLYKYIDFWEDGKQ
jgi:DNA invertase Pin-like site-specific DNA recombinase